MIIAETIADFKDCRKQMTGKVGFVPTLGALHKGHAELIKTAKKHADHVCVSVFLNPTQFGPNEDFDSYPSNLTGDIELCREIGVDVLFTPSASDMYPPYPRPPRTFQLTSVVVDDLTSVLCGASRPGHFAGVTTVVTKLLNIVQPDLAVFGQKDLQQLAIIRRMVADLNIPVDIVAHPIVREDDGLAVSSRNLRLTEEERAVAPQLYKALCKAKSAFGGGTVSCDAIEKIVRDEISQVPGFTIDYVKFVDASTLRTPMEEVINNPNADVVVAVAAHLGNVRLIDNLSLR